jgi:hypothetical protein
MRKQPKLPGIPDRPTAADVKAFVRSRLTGFELRQQERARRRSCEARLPESQPRQQAILEAALIGLEAQRQRIADQIAEVQAKLGRELPASADGLPRLRRRMSAAGRRRIDEAQKKRRAALKAAKAAPTKPKRRLSAAGRKAIAEAARKRWAAAKAAKASA